MKYTVIDSDNYTASGIETLFFPGGEPHAKIPRLKEDVLFFLKPRTWLDTGIGACVWDALNQQNARAASLFVPYFPAARQDKTDGTAPMTRDMMDVLFGGGDLHTFDVHSHPEVYTNWMPSDLNIPTRNDVVGIIAPDAGATDRAKDFRDEFYPTALIIQCFKKRDPHTGGLSGYDCPEIPMAGRYIIVDDICDGGGTFNLLAEAFCSKKKGRGSNLELFVSHGIFSKGLGNIDPRIEHITTTDSWCTYNRVINGAPKESRLTILPLEPLFTKIMGVE